jgi:hypothetical protein
MSDDGPLTSYRDHKIIYHVDAGYIVIYKNKVVYNALTLEEAKAWIDDHEILKGKDE